MECALTLCFRALRKKEKKSLSSLSKEKKERIRIKTLNTLIIYIYNS
jgi:hypothetical protein